MRWERGEGESELEAEERGDEIIGTSGERSRSQEGH